MSREYRNYEILMIRALERSENPIRDMWAIHRKYETVLPLREDFAKSLISNALFRGDTVSATWLEEAYFRGKGNFDIGQMSVLPALFINAIIKKDNQVLKWLCSRIKNDHHILRCPSMNIASISREILKEEEDIQFTE